MIFESYFSQEMEQILSRSQSLPSATALESSGRQDQNLRLSVPWEHWSCIEENKQNTALQSVLYQYYFITGIWVWPPTRGVNCIGHCGGEEWAIWVKFVLQISQIAPCHVFTYNRANTRTSMLKNLTFPNYEFGKGQCAFYPMKLSRFGKKKVCQKYQNFIRPYKLSQTPLDQKNNS